MTDLSKKRIHKPKMNRMLIEILCVTSDIVNGAVPVVNHGKFIKRALCKHLKICRTSNFSDDSCLTCVSEFRLGCVTRAILEAVNKILEGVVSLSEHESVVREALERYFTPCDIDFENSEAGEEAGCAY